MIDTHSHLYDAAFDTDRDEAIARAQAAGVGRLLLPAVDCESYDALFALSQRYPAYCRPMMGLHPTSVNDNPDYLADLDRVAGYLQSPPDGILFCGVGEIGLDFYWSRDFRQQQIRVLRIQIELALAYDLPIVVHTRDAWDEMCELLDDFRGRGLRGVMHSFCGTAEHYRRILSVGTFCFGIGGPVTYKKSAVAEVLPAMRPGDLVLETDSPYLPPVPYRGKRNESGYLPLICERIAAIYGISPDEVAETTTRNVRRIFGNAVLE